MAGDGTSDSAVESHLPTLDDVEVDRVGRILTRLEVLRSEQTSLCDMVSILSVEFPDPPGSEAWTPETVRMVLGIVDSVQAEQDCATTTQNGTPATAPQEPDVPSQADVSPEPETDPQPEADPEPVVHSEAEPEAETQPAADEGGERRAPREIEVPAADPVGPEPTTNAASMAPPDPRHGPAGGNATPTDEPVEHTLTRHDTLTIDQTRLEPNHDLRSDQVWFEDGDEVDDGYHHSPFVTIGQDAQDNTDDHLWVDADLDDAPIERRRPERHAGFGPRQRSVLGVGLMAMVLGAIGVGIGYGAHLLTSDVSAGTTSSALQNPDGSASSSEAQSASNESSLNQPEPGDSTEAADSTQTTGSTEAADSLQPIDTGTSADTTASTTLIVPPLSTDPASAGAPGDGTIVVQGAFATVAEADRYVTNLGVVFGSESIVQNHVINPKVTGPPDTGVVLAQVEYFLPNTADLDPRYLPLLDNVKDILTVNPHITLLIDAEPGTVDARDVDPDVAERRFEAIRNHLVRAGVDEGQLTGFWASSTAEPAPATTGDQQRQVVLTLNGAAADPDPEAPEATETG